MSGARIATQLMTSSTNGPKEAGINEQLISIAKKIEQASASPTEQALLINELCAIKIEASNKKVAGFQIETLKRYPNLVDEPDLYFGNTPFISACLAGNKQLIQFFAARKDVDFSAENNRGETGLAIVCSNFAGDEHKELRNIVMGIKQSTFRDSYYSAKSEILTKRGFLSFSQSQAAATSLPESVVKTGNSSPSERSPSGSLDQSPVQESLQAPSTDRRTLILA